MRVFVIAAMGAAVLAGCAPFQHGHYSEDVSYLVQSARVPQRTFAAAPSTSTWPQQTTSVAGNAFGAGGFPTLSSSQSTGSYSQPVSYSASAPAYNVQQVSVPAPAFSNSVSYAPALQQTYVPPARTTLTPTVQSYATSYGGHQVDADGFAICNVPWPDHAAHQTPKFKPSYQPASHVVRSRPQGPLRF